MPATHESLDLRGRRGLVRRPPVSTSPRLASLGAQARRDPGLIAAQERRVSHPVGEKTWSGESNRLSRVKAGYANQITPFHGSSRRD